MPEWFYSRDGQASGPLGEEQLRVMFASGQLGADVWVWREGMAEWVVAWQAGLLAASTPPPPAVSPNSWQQALGACRAKLGGPPRRLNLPLAQPPPYLYKVPKDELWDTYRWQKRLLTHGWAVWGHIVQANGQLFSKGPEDHPASVIYSTDPWFDASPTSLAAIARSLYDVKGKAHPNPEMAEFSRILAHERIRAPRLPVPRLLAGGRPVYHTSVMVVRAHLPQGYLTHSLFPLLAEPQRTTATFIVPWCFWPAEFVGLWNARAS